MGLQPLVTPVEEAVVTVEGNPGPGWVSLHLERVAQSRNGPVQVRSDELGMPFHSVRSRPPIHPGPRCQRATALVEQVCGPPDLVGSELADRGQHHVSQGRGSAPVSYTHLTLPTSDLV